MDIQVQKEPLSFSRPIGESTVRRTLKASASVPIPAGEVLDWEAAVREVKGVTGKDTVHVSGSILSAFIYTDEKRELRQGKEHLFFEVKVALAGTKPKQESRVRALLVNLEHTLAADGAAVSYMAEIEITVEVLAEELIQVVREVEGEDRIKTSNRPMRLESVQKTAHISSVFKESAHLPEAATEIKKIIVNPRNISVRRNNESVLISGDIYRQYIFNNADHLPRYFADSAPFTITEKLPVFAPEAEINAALSGYVLEQRLTESPGSQVEMKISCEGLITVTERKELSPVIDVVGPSIRVAKRTIQVETIMEKMSMADTISSIVTLPHAAENILQASAA